jgi:hypothetical protein
MRQIEKRISFRILFNFLRNHADLFLPLPFSLALSLPPPLFIYLVLNHLLKPSPQNYNLMWQIEKQILLQINFLWNQSELFLPLTLSLSFSLSPPLYSPLFIFNSPLGTVLPELQPDAANREANIFPDSSQLPSESSGKAFSNAGSTPWQSQSTSYR